MRIGEMECELCHRTVVSLSRLKEEDFPMGNVAVGMNLCNRCIKAAIRYEVRRRRKAVRLGLEEPDKDIVGL